jgi:hypothetical protein
MRTVKTEHFESVDESRDIRGSNNILLDMFESFAFRGAHSVRNTVVVARSEVKSRVCQGAKSYLHMSLTCIAARRRFHVQF